MSDLSGPFDDADEADVAEQSRPLVDEDGPAPLTGTPEDANEADAIEQATEVSDDDEDYPHGG